MERFNMLHEVTLNINAQGRNKVKNDVFKKASLALTSFKPLLQEATEENPIQVIDFFSGAGGTSLGFAAVNSVIPAFRFLGGCDINRISAETYGANFATPILNEDILNITHDEESMASFLDKIGYDASLPTILIGCAPCQGFSSHRKKHWNDEHDVRNNLALAFSKLVEYISPDAFLMENVPEFLSDRYWEYYSKAREVFVKAGYRIKQNIYNAAEFGVPQERFRSIIIGMKKDFLLPNGYFSPDKYKNVRDAIGNLVPIAAGKMDKNDIMHKAVAHKESTLEIIRQVPHDGGNRPSGVGPKCLTKVNGFSDVYSRLSWDKPAITITHYARNPASGRYTHPEQDRGLTAREAALLQSFPKGFLFKGKYDDMYRQIGEAVPPLLACGMAVNILIELLANIPSERELESSLQSIDGPVSSSYSSVIAGIKNTRRRP